MLNNEKAVSIYDTEKKHLIGSFKSIELCAKYLFKNYHDKHATRLSHSLSKKHKILQDTIFDFPIAIRMINDAQRILLGNNACYIIQGYPERMTKEGRIK